MPELPEIQAHAERLADALVGARLERVELLSFAVLKTYDPPVDAAVGEALEGVERHGKHLALRFASAAYVVHLMQGGRLRLGAAPKGRPRGGLLRWHFDERRTLLLTEAGTEHRVGVWVVAADPAVSPPVAGLGPDAADMDAAALGRALAEPPARLHTALRDQSRLAGIGRRLANEICHRARLSPFTQTAKLGEDEIDRVAGALAALIEESLAEERARTDLGKSSERTSAVHGRTGHPCPVCGDVVREVAYRAYTVHYCATCQTGGKVLADNTFSKLGIERDPVPVDD